MKKMMISCSLKILFPTGDTHSMDGFFLQHSPDAETIKKPPVLLLTMDHSGTFYQYQYCGSPAEKRRKEKGGTSCCACLFVQDLLTPCHSQHKESSLTCKKIVHVVYYVLYCHHLLIFTCLDVTEERWLTGYRICR
jgi:hypothetical protein